MRIGITIAILLTGFGHGFAQTPDAPKRHAFIVGVNKYDHEKVNPLAYCVNDADSLGELLKKQGYECTLLTDTTGAADAKSKPTRANVARELVGVLNRCRKIDTVVVSFSGHGCQFPDDKDGYFMPSDGLPFANRTDTLVPLGTIYTELDKSAAGLKVLIVDACRSEPGKRDLTRGVFLETTTVPKGIAALFACSNGEFALEAADYKHGIFFHHLLKGLEGEAAGKDGKVTFGRLADHVQTQVSEDVQKRYKGKQSQSPNVRADISGPPPVLSVVKGSVVPLNEPKAEALANCFYPTADAAKWQAKYPAIKPAYDPNHSNSPVANVGMELRALISGANGQGSACRVFDLATGKAMFPPVKLDEGESIWGFHPDGRRAIARKTLEKGYRLRLLDVESGSTIGAPMQFHQDSRSINFSPSGEEFDAGPALCRINGGYIFTNNGTCRWSTDGKLLSVIRERKRVPTLYKTSSWKEVDLDGFRKTLIGDYSIFPSDSDQSEAGIAARIRRQLLDNHSDSIRFLGIANSGEKTLVWRCTSGKETRLTKKEDFSEKYSYDFKEGLQIWSLTENKSLIGLNFDDFKYFYSTCLEDGKFSKNDDKILLSYRANSNLTKSMLYLYNATLNNAKPTVISFENSDLHHYYWDHTGDRFAAMTYHKANFKSDGGYQLDIYDGKTGESVGEPMLLGENEPKYTFSPDGKTLSAVWHNAAEVFDAKTGKSIRRIEWKAD